MRLPDSPTEGATKNRSGQLLWGKSVYLFCCLCATRTVSFLHCLCKSNKNGAHFHITAADSHWTEFGKTSADNWYQLNTVHYWKTTASRWPKAATRWQSWTEVYLSCWVCCSEFHLLRMFFRWYASLCLSMANAQQRTESLPTRKLPNVTLKHFLSLKKFTV